MTDAEMREDTIDQIYNNWHSRNADAAKAFLSNSGWPVARIERLQNDRSNKR